jgi:hypothetical protein
MRKPKDLFFEAPELLRPITPLKCDFCPNTFTGIDDRDARKRLFDHVERMRKAGKGHGAILVMA